MGTWQITGFIVLIAVVGMIGTAVWLVTHHSRERKKLLGERREAAKQAIAKQKIAEKTIAQKAAQGRLAAKRAAAERLTMRRADAERTASEKAAAEQAAVERAIAEWAIAEQAESDRVNSQQNVEEQRETEEMEARMHAVEDAIAEWVEADQRGGGRVKSTGKPNQEPERDLSQSEVVQQQVRLTAEEVNKENDELEFIKNRIAADVDFLPVEFKHTIDEWKVGKVFRRSTFDDLKLKFRYKAYSVEDGYELLHMYRSWIEQQYERLRVFIHLLGGTEDKSETIQASIERLEKNEQEKALEMDVDVIFTLQRIRKIQEKLIGVEILLRELDDVCQKRSDQIIAPPWEEKGTL